MQENKSFYNTTDKSKSVCSNPLRTEYVDSKNFCRVVNIDNGQVYATNLTKQQALDVCIELRQHTRFNFHVESVTNSVVTLLI